MYLYTYINVYMYKYIFTYIYKALSEFLTQNSTNKYNHCFFLLLLFSKVMELASAEWTPSHMNFLDLSLYSYKFVESNHMFLFLSTLKNSILKKDN